MTATRSLTTELRAEVKGLEADLRARVAAQPGVLADWRAQHKAAVDDGRTAASWQEWSDDRVTQAAAAWVLLTVFIRFVEDNRLIAPVWISGPKERREEALQAQAQFLRLAARANPDVTDREWLLEAISYGAKLPATRDLVDERSPLWLVTPSGDAATRLLDFWRQRDENGYLVRDLREDSWDTRFLGDLYENLSEEARDRYALRQTPVFVEEFILDRALEPALKERPLDGFLLIDPACGSGHFLLGAFARLMDRWHRAAPDLDSRARVQKALESIHGVDINPCAVAIARFRLTIAALKASGDKRLEDAPDFAYHLAVGDSLLHGLDQQEFDYGPEFSADRTAAAHVYPTENLAALRSILDNGRYDVVVGNPPYITVKDKASNARYRGRYRYCKGTYALTVPFMEKFFALARDGERAGWVGQITSNSFMKREFGAPLVEKFFPTKDLRLIADTSGAYIPGHGTPTVIIVGRNTRPVAETVRAVLGVRGEPGRPEVPAKGLVWTSIVEHVDELRYSDEWVTIADLDRNILAKHPWSLSGGGATELASRIVGACGTTLALRCSSIGYTGQTNSDDAFLAQRSVFRRNRIDPRLIRPFVTGDDVRDYLAFPSSFAVFPYVDTKLLQLEPETALWRWMWPSRTVLWARATFGKSTYRNEGRPWWEWHQVARSRLSGPVITWAFVQTSNHFAFLRSCLLHNRHAPMIKLSESADEDDYVALLGVLNSSTACFWLKQNSHDKGIRGEGGGFTPSDWERFYEFTGATLQDFPLPGSLPLARGRTLDNLARLLTSATPQSAVEAGAPLHEALESARHSYHQLRAELIAQQEELDWEVYRLYGLVDDDLTYAGMDLPPIDLGERAFEIVLSRRVDAGQEQTAWFDRHGSTRISDVSQHWPSAYRDLVEWRIALIESDPFLRLLERPEYKRRWMSEPWERQEERALRGWLLDRLEDRRFWFDRAGRPAPRSVAQLGDEVSRDPDLADVLALWEGRPDVPVVASLQKLLDEEAVPYLAAYRYKDSGLRKREAWEQAWKLQRREDRAEKVGTIPVPPKYNSADFTRKEYWAHRGKLDVPKERFVLYPDAGRDTDPTPLLGWAGWDDAQRALALAQLIQQREADGWDDERLVPLVAGLAESLPWVQQWHADPDPFYGGVSPAAFFTEQLDNRARQMGRTREQLAAWRPTPLRRGRARKAVTR